MKDNATKVLITGATGNVGIEVIKSLQNIDHQLDIYAGVRNLSAANMESAIKNVNLLPFDFEDPQTHQPALKDCDILFLLRPPQISDVPKYFEPIIDVCKASGVKHIIFLSVQGVERSKIIPHHKIEKLIVESKIPYTFLRPAYFMQNFTNTLHDDLVNKKRIYLPAGNAKFTLIDVRDIGVVTASILANISKHINQSYDLTTNESLTFAEMAAILSNHLGFEISYQSPNLINFFLTKRKENVPTMFILVMIMLHYLPRFQNEPKITNWVERITNKKPITFEQFVKDHEKILRPGTRKN